MKPPAYFERVRQSAARRWDQLEADPELAGPWHQLFSQVQSPRHVVSELLQNADDAGATEAKVTVQDRTFVFEHNGEDFKEEHFASLCRFGYSNKRALHTIGFRGIGFKSTFSLGGTVELETPSLSVAFHKKRFSEPVWAGNRASGDGRTRIRVHIADKNRQAEVEKNLADWLKNPLSLLFFKSIRRMQVGAKVMHWRRISDGPVANSEWMALEGEKDKPYLFIRSQAEAFPSEALEEIRQERMLREDQDMDFPPASVDIVLGGEGRLFVVLPTEVKTALPFACNAPFIQEPARIRIKDPGTSPTNRWLLERAGRLAAQTMLAWLGRADLPVPERAKAYGLLSDVDRNDSSFEGACAAMVEVALGGALGANPVLLTDDGRLTKEEEAVVIPDTVQEVWPGDQAAALLDSKGRPALAKAVAAADRKKLVNWNMAEEVDKDALFQVLQHKHLPRPKTWAQLRTLWTYLASDITAPWTSFSPEDLRIVPVQGSEVLYAATEVARLGEKKLLQSEDDWKFLGEFLIVANPNWMRHLAEQRLAAEQQKDASAMKAVGSCYAILKKIGLEETSDISAIADRVAAVFFRREEVDLEDCVRLAHIAATLGATIGSSFRYVTRDLKFREPEHVLVDLTGEVEELIPPGERDSSLLHEAYFKGFTSCTKDEWLAWVSSARAGIHGFLPLSERRMRFYGRESLEADVRRRGFSGTLGRPYVTTTYILEDWDFDDDAWSHWRALAGEDEQVWLKVAGAIFAQPDAYWNSATNAKAYQVATTGNERQVTWDPIVPRWAARLRELPCLPDTRSFPHKPVELLRRTVETDAYRDVEPFVHASFDREAKWPLLKLLGVRDKPAGVEQILGRLRMLSKAERPPVHEVEKWYVRIDQVLESASTDNLGKVRIAFRAEKIILTESGDWTTSSGVYLADDPAVPGAPVIRAAVRHLALWSRIDVSDRPTAERAIQWLKELPSAQTLPSDDAKRVRALLPLHASRIWEECGHWLNLAGEWAQIEDLKYGLSMQTLVTWSNLHEPIKQATADFRDLSAEVSGSAPFSRLPALALHIQDQIHGGLLKGAPEAKGWITALGTELRRVELEDEAETQRVRALGEELAATQWVSAPGLQVVPYIAGVPAGAPRRAEVVWRERLLHVDALPLAKLARRVPEEVGKLFGRQEIRAALDFGFDRAPEMVKAYMEQNFKLAPLAELTPTEAKDTASSKDESSAADKSRPHDEIPEESVEEPIQDGVESTSTDELLPNEQTDQAVEPVRPRVPPKPPKPSIMERFAAARGFRKDGDGRFFHPSGAWIGKTDGMQFPWERRSAQGELLVYYWAADHCLEQDALELDAETWHSLKSMPTRYALILVAPDGTPVELSGAQIQELEARGSLKLYPASYRVAMERKEHA